MRGHEKGRWAGGLCPGQEKVLGHARGERKTWRELSRGRRRRQESPVLSEACSFSTQTFVGKAPKGGDAMYFLSAGETQGEALLQADAGL